MRGEGALLGLLLLFIAWDSLAQKKVSPVITVMERELLIYDTAPKLKIKGDGFATAAEQGAFSLTFRPQLEEGKDYKLECKEKSLVLTLLPNQRWMEFEENRSSPKPLILTNASVGGEALPFEQFQVAAIIPTPTVAASSKIIFMTATPFIYINGTNFNTKHTALFFDPPLRLNIDVAMQIVSTSLIKVVKLQHYNEGKGLWAPEPGPLKLFAINTGGGRLRLQSDMSGVTIAEVQADGEGHSVTAERSSMPLYQSSPNVIIDGSGFRPEGTKIKFANSIKGGGVNYTVSSVKENRLMVTLEEGSKWMKNAAALPAPLVVLSADAGGGWVPLGAFTTKAGCSVAKIYEDPSVYPSTVTLERTQSHQLYIEGKGFTADPTPVFVFEPPLPIGSHSVHVISSSRVKIVLTSELTVLQAWMKEGHTGPLMVTGVDTGAGLVEFPEPVQVATVKDVSGAHESGIAVFADHAQVLYQSDKSPLIILGKGFDSVSNSTPVVEFAGGAPAASNVIVTVESGCILSLELMEGTLWLSAGGSVEVTRITLGNVEVKYDVGIKVATILRTPSVFPDTQHLYATRTKVFTLHGFGFLSSVNPHMKPVVVLRPTPVQDIDIESEWSDDVLVVRLIGTSWVGDLSLQPKLVAGEVVNLEVVSIDTGGGPVMMPDGGVAVALVHEDDEEAVCEDTCYHANDNQCDESFDDQSFDMGGWGAHGSSKGNSNAGTSYSSANRFSLMSGVAVGAPCAPGTDCTDCGIHVVLTGKCENTCKYSRDGMCDDSRVLGACSDGTDCQDCGPWGQSNFTAPLALDSQETSTVDSTSEMADDFVDKMFVGYSNHLVQAQKMNTKSVYRRNFKNNISGMHKENEYSARFFMSVLWSVIFLVGGTMSIGVAVLGHRYCRGDPLLPMVPGMDVLDPQSAPHQALTPDVVQVNPPAHIIQGGAMCT